MTQSIWAVQEGSLNICGLTIEHGLPPTKQLKFTPGEQFKSSRDTAGNVCRSRMNDPIVKLELTLYNWSKHNKQLSALHAADTLDNAGAGLGIFSWVHNATSTKVISDACWIVKAPDWEVGEEEREVTWMLEIVAPPEQRIFGDDT